MVVSCAESLSSAAKTVTVCAVSQFEVKKIRTDGLAVTSVLSVVLSLGSLMVTATSPVGCVSSTTVYVPEPPSLISSDVGVTVTPRISLSSTVTVTVTLSTES